MLAWLQAIAGLGSIASLLRTLALPFAFLWGKFQAINAQWKINEKLQQVYDDIEKKQLTDEDIDKRLDDGTL